VSRLATILSEFLPLVVHYTRDFHIAPLVTDTSIINKEELQRNHAVRLRESLTKLGPAFVKLGQQLSIRPDLLPAVVLKELQQLCDSVKPIEDKIAFSTIVNELGNIILSDDDSTYQ